MARKLPINIVKPKKRKALNEEFSKNDNQSKE
jgi:hypothetical protein